jgi:UDP-3-O-[3-hydroxymyristoyl] glucosamine N-acyltransferase
MQFTAAQIALLINGKIEGDPQAIITGFGKIEEAQQGQLSFLANPKYEDYLYTTGASLVIINEQLELKKPVAGTLIRVPDAYSAFATLLTKYQELQTQQLSGIQEPSYIAPSAQLGQQVFVAAFCHIADQVIVGDHTKLFPGVVLGRGVRIGKGCIIHAGVKIYHDCVIGDHVTIHAGAVIGSDGFGFAPQADGTYQKVPQIGHVVIEDNVEIGANSTIDRATMGATIIHAGAKLDNLIQVAHNVEIGNHTVIAAQTGISGSTKIGKRVMIGGQAGIAGHLSIADGCKINAKSGISKTVKEANRSLTGNPADDFNKVMRMQAYQKQLPEMEKRLKELEKMVAQLLEERANAS